MIMQSATLPTSGDAVIMQFVTADYRSGTRLTLSAVTNCMITAWVREADSWCDQRRW